MTLQRPKVRKNPRKNIFHLAQNEKIRYSIGVAGEIRLAHQQGTNKMAKKVEVPTTKSGLMAALAEAGEVSKKQAVAIYDKLIELAYEGARQNEKGWVIPGLGKLLIKKQGARKVRNPQTGEEIKKPACKVAKFRLAKAAKDALVPPKAKK